MVRRRIRWTLRFQSADQTTKVTLTISLGTVYRPEFDSRTGTREKDTYWRLIFDGDLPDLSSFHGEEIEAYTMAELKTELLRRLRVQA